MHVASYMLVLLLFGGVRPAHSDDPNQSMFPPNFETVELNIITKLRGLFMYKIIQYLLFGHINLV